jgi:hypothetical protein
VALKRMIRAPKVRKPTITRSAIKSIDDKFYGSEPIDVSIRGYSEALNWYNYMHEQEQARDWLLEYLKRSNFQREEIACVRRCPKYRVPTTVGWQARMMMNGNQLTEQSMVFFKEHVDRLLEMGATVKEATPKSDQPVVSIRERTEAKIKLLMIDCEEAIDSDPQLNIYDWLKGKEASPQAATAISNYYSKWIADFEYVDETTTRTEKKRNAELLKYWTQFVSDCERYVGNKKVTKVRKPKTIKLKAPTDLVKNLKFQKEFPPLRIVSCNPAEIIGCQQLWTYNTKSRKLTKYDALGPNGIQVKGTTLTGFDVEKSSTKTLRKPEDTIKSLLNAGKVLVRKFMDELKTQETKPNGRINSDTILLRVIK